MSSEKSKQHRNKWYRDHVNKYCVCVNKSEVEVVGYIEDLLKRKSLVNMLKIKLKKIWKKKIICYYIYVRNKERKSDMYVRLTRGETC